MFNCCLISSLVAVSCLMQAGSRHTKFTEFYLESAKIINGTANVPFRGNVTLKRIGHNHPKVFFEFETENLRNYHVNFIHFDTNGTEFYLKNVYQTEAEIYYSPMGNRRFMLLPYKFTRQPICTVLNTGTAHKMIESLQNFSNLPDCDEKIELCELMSMQHYMVHDYELVPSVLPSPQRADIAFKRCSMKTKRTRS